LDNPHPFGRASTRPFTSLSPANDISLLSEFLRETSVEPMDVLRRSAIIELLTPKIAISRGMMN